MAKYVQVIVDIPVSKLDKVYDYVLPEKNKNKFKIGCVVNVPFGRRNVKGFIVGFTDSPQIDKDKIRQVKGLVIEERLFDQKMLKLFKWISGYYHSYLNKIIKTAIPTGVVSGKVGKKKKSYFRIAQSKEKTKEIINSIKDKAPKQAAVLNVLLNNNLNDYTAADLAKVADTYCNTVYRLRDKGYIQYYHRVEKRRPFMEKDNAESNFLKPTVAQKKAINKINDSLQAEKANVFLLHGVTGSGKTEVYLNIIAEVFRQGKGAIVLVPEISLTPVMVKRFYSRFGNKIAVMHSNLSLGERYDEWRRLKEGEARVVIGARSAIFAPVQELGLIIIDEEHENSYKQGEYPYYHARCVAMKRGEVEGAPVILGSATPSLESFYAAQEGFYEYVSLPQRVQCNELPPVEVIDMREELKEGNVSIFSQKLNKEIKAALDRGEQILLFLNRRGYSNFVLCRECGHVIKCKNCDISLTYHVSEDNLRCHYCDYIRKMPEVCPECGSRYIRDFGIGTEKIEEEVKKTFPEASVERMDVDTTTRKGSHRQILKKIEDGETDILVGTQMIAKGHDYPNISVVGVITADTILNLPDFRSGERTFQLLTQVAGRTGRGSKPGKVIIQTYTPDHYSIQAARNHNYNLFFRQEIGLRNDLSYPPFVKLVNIIIKGPAEEAVTEAAIKLGIFLEQYTKIILEILGPGPAPINKIRGKYRWQIILKFSNHNKRNVLIDRIEGDFLPWDDDTVNFNIDVDPLTMI